MHWSERLNKRVEELGWTKQELSRRSGISYDRINKYMRGDVDNPRGDVPERLAAAIGVEPVWLGYGETRPAELISTDRDTLGVNRLPPEQKLIPLVSWAIVGRPNNANNTRSAKISEGFIVGDTSLGPRTFALRVENDCMFPRFQPGDIIICDPSAPVEPGEFVIAKVEDDESPVLMMYRPHGVRSGDNENFELVPLNKDYPTISSGESYSTTILAKVVRRIEVL